MSLVSSNEIPITVYEEPIVTGGDWIKHSGPSDNYINTNKVGSHKLYVESTSDNHRPITAGIARSFMGDDNVWVADMLFNSPGDEFINKHKCFNVFYSTKDACAQELSLDDSVSSEFPFLKTRRNGHRYEISTSRYTTLGNDDTSYDTISLIDNSASYVIDPDLINEPNDLEEEYFLDCGEGQIYIHGNYQRLRGFILAESAPGVDRITVRMDSSYPGLRFAIIVEAPIGSTASEISSAINNGDRIPPWVSSVKRDGVVDLVKYVNTDIEYTRYSDMESYKVVDEKVVKYIYDDAIEIIPTNKYDTSVSLRFIMFGRKNGVAELGQPSNTNDIDIAYSQSNDTIEIYYLDTSTASDIVDKLNAFSFTQGRFSFKSIDGTKVVASNDVDYSGSQSAPDFNSTDNGASGNNSWFSWKQGVVINNSRNDQEGAVNMNENTTWTHYTRIVEDNFVRLDGYNRIFITNEQVDRDEIISINNRFRFNELYTNDEIGSTRGSIGWMSQSVTSTSFVNDRTDFGNNTNLKEISEYNYVFEESAVYDKYLNITTVSDYSQGGIQISVEEAPSGSNRSWEFDKNRYTVKLMPTDNFGNLKDFLTLAIPDEYDSVAFSVATENLNKRPTLQTPDYKHGVNEISEEIVEVPNRRLIHKSNVPGFSGVRYFSVVGVDESGLHKTLDKDWFEAYSSNGSLEVYYTNNSEPGMLEYSINTFNNVYPQGYVGPDGALTYDGRTDSQVMSVTNESGMFIDYGIETFPETSSDGIIHGQKINFDGADDYDNAPVINNSEDSDQSKVVYDVSSYWLDNDDISMDFGYDGIAVGLDMFVERNRRHSALSIASPYSINKPLDNGSIIKYDKLYGSRIDITATQGYHAEIKNKLSLSDYNTDIIETVVISRSAGAVGGPGLFTNFSGFNRDKYTTFENIGGVYYTTYITMEDPGSTVYSDIVREDSTSVIMTHDLGTEDVIINIYNASGITEVIKEVKVLDGNRVQLESLTSLIGYNVVIITDDNIFSGNVNSGISIVEHNLGTKNVQVQVYDGKNMYIPSSIRSITNNSIEVNTSYSGNIVILSSSNTGSYVETGITRPTKEAISIGHALDSTNVTVRAYNSFNEVVIPSSISISSKDTVDIEFSSAVDDHVVVVTKGNSSSASEYTGGRRKVSGAALDHNGNYVLYLSNFSPKQDYPDCDIVELAMFVGPVTKYVLSRKKWELFRPMIKPMFGSGYFKITSEIPDSKTITEDGLVSVKYNIETTFGVGQFSNGHLNCTSCVYYNESYINAGSRAIVGGKVDLGSDRVSDQDILLATLMTVKGYNPVGGISTHFDGVDYSNYNIWSSSPNSVEWNGEYLNATITSWDLSGRKTGNVKVSTITSGKAWKVNGGDLLPYVGREVPCYEFYIDTTELLMNNGLDYHSNISIPGRKRWLHSMIKAGYSAMVDPIDGCDITYRAQVYNNSTGLWDNLSAEEHANRGVNTELISSEDNGYLKYIDIISDKDMYINSNNIMGIRVYTDGISKSIDSENVWAGDINFDYTKAGISEGITDVHMSYFRLASV